MAFSARGLYRSCVGPTGMLDSYSDSWISRCGKSNQGRVPVSMLPRDRAAEREGARIILTDTDLLTMSLPPQARRYTGKLPGGRTLRRHVLGVMASLSA